MCAAPPSGGCAIAILRPFPRHYQCQFFPRTKALYLYKNLQRKWMIGLGLVCSAGLVLVCWLMVGSLSVASILLPMVICTAGTTITRPAATSCALERHPTRAGAAAALSNTMLFAIGGLASGLIALAGENLAEYLGLGFIAVGLCGGLMIKRLSSHPPASANVNT